MRRKRAKILRLIVLSLFFCVSLFGQNKVAVVDSDAFYDEKSGITELVSANKKIEAEFQPFQKELESLNERLKKIVIEVENVHGYRGTKITESEVKKKSEELRLEAQDLSNKIKTITDELPIRLQERKSEILEPIQKKIGEKAQEFAKKNGYAIIVDISKMREPFITHLDNDVTNEFIKFCNEEFDKEKITKTMSRKSIILSAQK